MPPRQKVPTYRLHKSSGQARVILAGRHIYLGRYGSPESREAYARLLAETFRPGTQPFDAAAPVGSCSDLTMNELMVRYLGFAEHYYVKDGKPTKELTCMKEALGHLRGLYGSLLASEFGPLKLKAVREQMIGAGLARGVINNRVNRIKRFVKWAVSEELVPAGFYQALQSVSGLRFGRSEARETEPVRPVPDAWVDATLPCLSPQVAAMVQLQRLAQFANRLIGGTLVDIVAATTKVAIAERLIRGLQERPRITPVRDTWHNATAELKRCDIIVGAVDSFKEREQLERFARRHLIPYIDIGMDVHDLGNERYLIGGQVILSMPDKACLRCYGLITEERLALEANRYGAAGSRPQVVWPNGVLASTAVGLVVQLLTPWFKEPSESLYLDYDGNRGTLTPNDRMELLRNKACPHHPPEETGDPLFDVREFNKLRADLALTKVKSPPMPAPTSWWQSIWAALARMFGF